MRKFIDLTGMVFGRLAVIGLDPNQKEGQKKSQWLCKCSCGNIKSIQRSNLKSGSTKSCGCLNQELFDAGGNNLRHGQSSKGKFTKEYRTWCSMKARCHIPSATGYDRYGGQGISVCERWRNSFENFFEDMGKCPENKNSIDRIDNSKGYYKENCRWATSKEQRHNQRAALMMIPLFGKTQCLTDWCHELNMPVDMVMDRIYGCKWDILQALLVPKTKGLKA